MTLPLKKGDELTMGGRTAFVVCVGIATIASWSNIRALTVFLKTRPLEGFR